MQNKVISFYILKTKLENVANSELVDTLGLFGSGVEESKE